MSKKPVLVIMAAGMGSRYGGLKQIDPVDPYGNMIIDFSIYDAKQAGFEKVIFIIKKAIDEAFREGIGKRIEKYMDVEYAYQELDVLPKGYEVPEGRVKPWGTGLSIILLPFLVRQIHLLAQLPAVLLRQNRLNAGQKRVFRRIECVLQIKIQPLSGAV